MRSVFAVGLAVFALSACKSSGTSLQVGTMPEGGTFSGVFFSPQYGEMHMVQNGTAVVGKYKKDERSGDLQGEAEGDVMKFEWVEYKAMVSNRPQSSRGHGYFRYMVDPASGDHVLKGRWGLGDDDTDGGEWNAYKSKTREPDLDSLGGGESSGGESGSSEGDSTSSDEGSSDEGSSSGSDASEEDDSEDDFF